MSVKRQKRNAPLRWRSIPENRKSDPSAIGTQKGKGGGGEKTHLPEKNYGKRGGKAMCVLDSSIWGQSKQKTYSRRVEGEAQSLHATMGEYSLASIVERERITATLTTSLYNEPEPEGGTD